MPSLSHFLALDPVRNVPLHKCRGTKGIFIGKYQSAWRNTRIKNDKVFWIVKPNPIKFSGYKWTREKERAINTIFITGFIPALQLVCGVVNAFVNSRVQLKSKELYTKSSVLSSGIRLSTGMCIWSRGGPREEGCCYGKVQKFATNLIFFYFESLLLSLCFKVLWRLLKMFAGTFCSQSLLKNDPIK